MVSLGNMADVDFADTINYYAKDENTSCIALYVEGAKNGRQFIDAGRKAGKPIIALKSGVSAHGAAAAASHTGSLAGAVKVYDAAFNQAKVIRAMDLDELLDSAQALSMQPTMKGENVVVITNGGGIGVLSSDSAEAHGIPLHPAPKDLQVCFETNRFLLLLLLSLPFLVFLALMSCASLASDLFEDKLLSLLSHKTFFIILAKEK